MADLLTLRRSCFPCVQGEHKMCRHRPDDQGNTMWVGEGDDRRLIRVKWLGHGYEKNPDGSYVEYPDDPCRCEQSKHKAGEGTCDAWMSGDFGRGMRCGKPSKVTMEVISRFSPGTTTEKELCGVHAAARRRVVANDEARRLQDVAARERMDRQEAANRAAEDWAEKLATEFGIPVEPRKGEPIRVELHPEKLYAILAEVRGLLDEVYDEHPFKMDRSRLT